VAVVRRVFPQGFQPGSGLEEGQKEEETRMRMRMRTRMRMRIKINVS
jgi:hypothetical protein